jgi:MoxR-like ATPase
MTVENRAAFEQALFAAFPEAKTSGTVSRSQIVQVMETIGTKKYPTWLMSNRVGRGLYAVSGNAALKPVETFNESVVVDYTDSKSLIPSVDKNYVPFGNYKDLEKIITSELFYPVFISGPTGNGKSTSIEQICAKRKRPLIRINFNSMTDEDQLIGSKTLVDGNVQVIEGPLLIAMRNGIPILLDEIDAGNSNTLMCLQPILEGKPYYFKLKNELIYPKAGFNIFATANTKGKGSDDGRYIGTNVLNEAFLERFAVTFDQDYPDQKIELKIVTNLMKSFNVLDEQFANDLIKWADSIRRTFKEGGVDENITTRRLIHIVRAFAIFDNKKKAIELCTNRFDDATRIAFLDLFDKLSNVETDDLSTQAAPIQRIDDEIPF